MQIVVIVKYIIRTISLHGIWRAVRACTYVSPVFSIIYKACKRRAYYQHKSLLRDVSIVKHGFTTGNIRENSQYKMIMIQIRRAL